MADRACTNHHCWGRDCCPNLQCECACHARNALAEGRGPAVNIGSASRVHGRRPVVGDWADDAACRGSDPELFHPGPHDPWLPVVEVCRTCPVVAPCLEHALRWGEAGIWGGTTAAQRRRMIAKGPR